MPRRKIDRALDASLSRISAARSHPFFERDVNAIKARIDAEAEMPKPRAHSGMPLIEQLPGYIQETPTNGYFGGARYNGPYYDLRHLCDMHHLLWPDDAEVLLKMILTPEGADPWAVLASLASAPCPPQHHWDIWRMAAKGLRMPRRSERQRARKVTAHGRPRVLGSGLSSAVIAEMYGDIQARTVRYAIEACWAYLRRHGLRRDVAKKIGLTGQEYQTVLFLEMPRVIRGSTAAEYEKALMGTVTKNKRKGKNRLP